MSVIHINQLKRTFGSGARAVAAVQGVDLRVEEGEIIALLGPNGAGKSTLIDMILGLTSPTAGTVEVFGGSPREAVTAERVGAALQTGGLLPGLSVARTVEMIAATFARPRAVEEVLEEAHLTPIANRRVAKCSGGEKQRLRFALALLPDPDLLILDEPTAGMDVTSRKRFWESIRRQAEAGCTVLFATHHLEEAQDIARRIVMMAGGRVVADGPTAEIREQAAARTVSAILPEGYDAARAPAALRVRTEGDRTFIDTADSDALARHLLTEAGARDVLIPAASLDEAFEALTREGSGNDPASGVEDQSKGETR